MRCECLLLLICILKYTNGIDDATTPKRTSNQEVKAAVLDAEKSLAQPRPSRSSTVGGANIALSSDSPAFLSRVFNRPSSAALQLAREGRVVVATSRRLQRRASRSSRNPQSTFDVSNIPFPKFAASSCFEQYSCRPNYKYRTIDGSCNNLIFPALGKAVRAFNRLLLPDYENGIDKPRRNFYGFPLPSARKVSALTTSTSSQEEKNFTLMLMQWGQFLDHDLTHTPVESGKGFQIACCSGHNNLPPQSLHSACFPIEIPANDSFYGKYNVRCMEFVRSLPAPSGYCDKGYREQMNQITAFIDASNVYGSEESTASKLREFKGGRLLITTDGKSLLPLDTDKTSCVFSAQAPCFKAGDSRANEQPHLALMHTIWVREHNRIAKKLAELNPAWIDEKLYQEARRIVGAEMQHITYNEWLPIILGETFVKANELEPRKSGYAQFYDVFVDPTITNSFATAAYRFGHTLIQGHIELYSSSSTIEEQVPLSKKFFHTDLLFNKFKSLIRGLTNQKTQDFDSRFTDQIRDKLFAGNSKFGLDLVALNTQRGRDHGLPGYNEYRHHCHLNYAFSFDDLKDDLGEENVAKLKKVYYSVDDIDLFIGGVMEKKADGAMVGKTFQCIIGDQFNKLKFGDRFFYEFGDSTATRFSLPQLQEIRKTSLARIMCDNSGEIGRIQPQIFKKKGYMNEPQLCSDYTKIPKVDLEAWKE